jgi:hypothetical protein
MTGQDGSVVYNGTPHNHTPIYSSEGKEGKLPSEWRSCRAAAAT